MNNNFFELVIVRGTHRKDKTLFIKTTKEFYESFGLPSEFAVLENGESKETYEQVKQHLSCSRFVAVFGEFKCVKSLLPYLSLTTSATVISYFIDEENEEEILIDELLTVLHLFHLKVGE